MSGFDKYHLSDQAKIVTDFIPGPESRKLLDEQEEL